MIVIENLKGSPYGDITILTTTSGIHDIPTIIYGSALAAARDRNRIGAAVWQLPEDGAVALWEHKSSTDVRPSQAPRIDYGNPVPLPVLLNFADTQAQRALRWVDNPADLRIEIFAPWQ